jgi:cbb3-type cytochrome oxidase subunit 3
MLEKLKNLLDSLQYAHVIWGMLVLVALWVWAYWPSNKSGFDKTAASILRDDP